MNSDIPKDIAVDVDDRNISVYKGYVNGTADTDYQPGHEVSDVRIDQNSCGKEDLNFDGDNKSDDSKAVEAQAQFPKPQPPTEEPNVERSQSVSLAESMPGIGKYIRDRSSTLSAAIMKRLSSLKEDGVDFVVNNESLNFEVTEIQIPGVKVIVKLKSDDDRFDFKGRITFFSRSNCRDCTAVRKFFREKRLPYVEINTDVFPKRAKELIERTGKSEVPQIFFNEKLLGGLVTLNSLRNSGELETRMRELLSQKCPDAAPKIPVYGFDDDEEAEHEKDELLGIVQMLCNS